uniref:Uncharacterized protein n=1 Tax=Romanomermis culicivorax TaxID=13658 RepID=A0A915I6S7_ROMCU
MIFIKFCALSIIFSAFLAIGDAGIFNFLKPGRKQKVSVQGQLLCGKEPAQGILVKLVDKDTISDDKMGETKTDSNGKFFVEGTEKELGNIEPTIKVYHTCKKGLLRCDRKLSVTVPKDYINSGRTMDMGAINLELKFPGEKHDCWH